MPETYVNAEDVRTQIKYNGNACTASSKFTVFAALLTLFLMLLSLLLPCIINIKPAIVLRFSLIWLNAEFIDSISCNDTSHRIS
jgi:hypothetical protein